MSLFDVIKYPVSCPPTYAELYAIPKVAYLTWISKSFGSSIAMNSVQLTLSDLWYRGNYPTAREDVIKSIESLRHEIAILP